MTQAAAPSTAPDLGLRRVESGARLVDYTHLMARRRVGPWDRLSPAEIVALLPTLPDWPTAEAMAGPTGSALRYRTRRNLRAAARVLDWLLTHPGDGWQDRWIAAGADRGLDWVETLDPDDRRTVRVQRIEITGALSCLMLQRVILPSYDFLASYASGVLLARVRAISRPDLFARLDQAGKDAGLSELQRNEALGMISRIVLYTGRDVDQLTVEDLLEAFAACRYHSGRKAYGLHNAWSMLGVLGVTPPGSTLRAALLHGQRSAADLVDDYPIRCGPVREVLIRYLNERRPELDYNSFRDIASVLAGKFWADIEHHHPGIDSLHLPDDVALAWKERMRVVVTDKEIRPRRDMLRILTRVRTFYLDIQQWALEDASWAQWAVPCPVSKRDTKGFIKLVKARRAAMHQRVRERLPHLPWLTDTADHLRTDSATLLAKASNHSPGEAFDHAGTRYRRTVPAITNRRVDPCADVRVTNLATNQTINLSQREDDAFWGWAIIETLRHTGVRIEELLEITHLALVSYRLPDTGELVPLLQIVPSKSNEERLLLVSPELASVLATIVTRLRARHGGTVPLVTRFDRYERVTSPAMPHLFQRVRGGRPQVITDATVRKMINRLLAASGLRDAANQPLTYTPHDFRRMFATEAVTGGLPVHIAARLLGHASLETTQAYLAVFEEDLVRSYRAFLDRRRTSRPTEEYREPTDQEWEEFQQHFQVRKLELGTCGRPYGTPCKHEHACIRCPMLRVDHRQRHRLTEIIRNLAERITEARMNGWLGEVQGLQVSLDAAIAKLTTLDKIKPPRPTHLGMPILNPRVQP